MQHISTAGYHAEIARVPAIANQLGVYLQVATHSIQQCLEAGDAEKGDAAAASMAANASLGQHTYIVTQCLLRAAQESHPNGKLLQPLVHSLQSRSLDRWVHRVRQLSPGNSRPAASVRRLTPPCLYAVARTPSLSAS